MLPEEAVGMLEAARTARRLRDPRWCGEGVDRGECRINCRGRW